MKKQSKEKFIYLVLKEFDGYAEAWLENTLSDVVTYIFDTIEMEYDDDLIESEELEALDVKKLQNEIKTKNFYELKICKNSIKLTIKKYKL